MNLKLEFRSKTQTKLQTHRVAEERILRLVAPAAG